MKFKTRTLEQIAEMICGNFPTDESYFVYRSSSNLTKFFQDADSDYRHDGSTRQWWVSATLQKVLDEPQTNPILPSDTFCRVINTLMDQSDAINEGKERPNALAKLNIVLSREGYEAFYAPDGNCYLRHIGTATVAMFSTNPHRPLTEVERKKGNV